MAFTNDSLSIELYFDLDNTRFRLKDNSDYAGEGISTSDVVGVYTCTDPNSNILHQNADFNNPDIDIDVSLYSAYKTFTVAAGVYTVVYSVYDSNTTTTYAKTFTFTYATTDIPTITISIESDVGLATISSTDETSYTDTITLNTRTHTLTYPASWGSTTTTSIVVNSISLTELYTGEYDTSISSNITNSKANDLIITKTITGTQTHDVWDTDGFYVIKDALNEFYDLWQTNQTDNPKEGRRQAEVWNEINSNYSLYNSYKQNGDIENAGEYLNNIKVLLAAESIDTTIDPSLSVPVTQAIPGYASQWLSGSGAPAASLGRTADFYRDIDTNLTYTKASGSWVADGNLSGYIFSLTPGTVLVPTDSDGNNADYTNAISDIIVYQYNDDVSDDFTFTKSTLSNADGTVTDNTLTVTSITADTGYIDVDVSQTGVATFTARIYVKKVKDGQAVVDATSVDDKTIELDGTDKLRFKKENNRYFYDIANSTGVIDDDGTYDIFMDWISETRFAYTLYFTNELKCGNYSDGVFTVVGNTYSIIGDIRNIKNFGYNRIVVNRLNVTNNYIETLSFDGTNWTVDASILIGSAGDYIQEIVQMDYNSVGCLIYDSGRSVMTLRKYYFTGSSWRLIAEEYSTGLTASDAAQYFSMVRLEDNSIGIYSSGDTSFTVYNFFDPLAPGESNGSGSVSIEDAYWYEAYSHTLSIGDSVRIYNIGDGEILISRPSQNKIYNYYYERGQLCVVPNTYSISADTFTTINMLKMPTGILIVHGQSGAAKPLYSLLRYKII